LLSSLLTVAFLVAGMLHPGLFENENDEHRLPKQSVPCLALHALPVCALGSLIQYLASHQIDAKRRSVVFTVLLCLACLFMRLVCIVSEAWRMKTSRACETITVLWTT